MPDEKQKSKRGEQPERYNQYWGFAVIFLMLGIAIFAHVGMSKFNLGLHAPAMLIGFVSYFMLPQLVWSLRCYWKNTGCFLYLRNAIRLFIYSVICMPFGVLLWIAGVFVFGILGLLDVPLTLILLLVMMVFIMFLLVRARQQIKAVSRSDMLELLEVYTLVALTVILLSFLGLAMAHTNQLPVVLGNSTYYIVYSTGSSYGSYQEYIARCNAAGMNCRRVEELYPLPERMDELHVEGDTLQLLNWRGEILREYHP